MLRLNKVRTLLEGRKGFATLFILILGAVFVLIASSLYYFISSEDQENITTARSSTSQSRLTFMGQCMEADFYNNFLQSEFERIIAEFLSEGVHKIDTGSDFMSNLGTKLESLLSEEASSIIGGDAARVYSTAYSTMPSTSCHPESRGEETAYTSLIVDDKGVVVNSMSAGQVVSCRDEEADKEVTIDLRARDYRLQTRVLQIYNEAVKSIREIHKRLEQTEGSYVWRNAWRTPEDEESKRRVLRDWNTKISLLGLLSKFDEKNGIGVVPGSIEIRARDGREYEVSDLKVVCYGSMKPAFEVKQTNDVAQTCRPDDLTIVIGASPQNSENTVKLDLEKKNAALDVTVSYNGVTTTASSKLIGKLLGSMIDPLVEKGLKQGYVEYGDVVQLCDAFMGRPSEAEISGTVVDENSDYLPGGVDKITFNFVSRQSLDQSDLENKETCEGKDEIIRSNVWDLLTNGGEDEFELHIEQGPEIKEEDLNKLQETINKNVLVSTTGEKKRVVLHAKVEKGETPISSNSVSAPPAPSPPPGALGNGKVKEEDSRLKSLFQSLKEGDALKVMSSVRGVLDETSAEILSLGDTENAEALAKTSSVVCKMISVQNWMDKGDYEHAMLAICGIARNMDIEGAKNICDLAALYSAVERGDMNALLSLLSRMVGDAGLGEFIVSAEQIQQALESGNVEDVLLAASTAARLGGENEISDYLANAASLVYTLEHGEDVYSSLSQLAALLGETKLSQIFSSAGVLEEAVNSGDARQILSAAADMAELFGYHALSEVEGLVGEGERIANLIGDLGNLRESCEGIPWDLICTVPQVGGGVCEDTWGDCTFAAGLPTFDVEKLCNDLVFDFGFQIDCTCTYTCPNFPFYAAYEKSVGVNLRELGLVLNPDRFIEELEQRLGMSLEEFKSKYDISQYCRFDP